MRNGRTMHFVGVGGVGMSGLAALYHEQGHAVTGCDLKMGSLQQRLQQQGIPILIGHHPGHLTKDVGLVIYSQAIPSHEPELLEAHARGIPIMSRGKLLAELAASKQLVAVAGAHGKTTTSGMSAQLLMHAGWDPSVMVGGQVVSLGSNARLGQGRYLVAETDESDGSFLLLHPAIAIVTNIDREHLNYYHSLENLIAAFQTFVRQLGPQGLLIRCADDPLTRQHLTHPRQLSYGIEAAADVQAGPIRQRGWGSAFTASYRGQRLGTFQIQVPGRHNVLNALAVLSLGLALDLPLTTIREALRTFRGTARRCQRLQLPNDIWFVDDYAHHPAEIQATLLADPSTARRRLVVFQPHRFSRVKLLEQEFARSFDQADGLIVTDIYSAFEPPLAQVSGERLARLIKACGHPLVQYVPRTELLDFLRPSVQPHDTVFFLGAGDISELCHELATELRQASRAAR